MHVKDQDNSPSETRQATVSVTREVYLKKRPAYHLKQDRPQAVSPEECTLRAKPTHPLKQDRPVCVTTRVHMESQANSPTEMRQATVCHQKSAHQEPGQLTS